MSDRLQSIDNLIAGSARTTKKLNEKIVDIEQKRKEDLAKKQAEAKNLPYIDLMGFAIGPEALKTISIQNAKKYKVVCFLLLEGIARFGATDPNNEKVKNLVNTVSKKNHIKGDTYLISEHSFNQALKIYEHLPKPRIKVKGIDISADELEKFASDINKLDGFTKKLESVSTTDLITLLIAAAVKMRASDVHLEPRETTLDVRFRIDGVMHFITTLPKEKARHASSRIKLLAGLKLNVVNRPQDGRFTIKLPNDQIDVRASSLPTNTGETITMRLLMASIANLQMEQIGLNKEALRVLNKLIKQPKGMVIATGPTGSGKTTTLYSIMNKLNDGDTKIITIEDPIEYRLPNISQSQVNPKKNYTFTSGLESIVRQDPDILMVGEIRDKDTASIAIQAALTGHLVLTTLHTNDASGAPARMKSLEASGELFASALNVAIGQRLLRKLCINCKKEHALTVEESKHVNNLIESWPKDYSMSPPSISKLKFFEPVGCEKCNGFGYWGRIGIFELLLGDEKVKNAIIQGNAAEHQIRKLAKESGMISMMQDGLLKVGEGVTSLEELLRVVGKEYIY
jgi:type IV pilus assembly protein PilB